MKRIFFLLAFFILISINSLYTQWVEANYGLNKSTMNSIVVKDTCLYTSSLGYGIFKSTDEGSHWRQVNTGLVDNYIYSLAVKDNKLFAGGNGNVYMSTDDGENWVSIKDTIPTAYIVSLVVKDTVVYACTAGFGIYMTTNYGTSWKY